MAKKSKKSKSEVVVTPEEASSDVVSEVSEEEVKTKPARKKKKNKPDTTDIDEEEHESPRKKLKQTAGAESVMSNINKQKDGGSLARNSRDRMKADYAYITSFLGAIHIPKHKNVSQDILDSDNEDGESLEEKQKRVKPGQTARANTREELQERLKSKLEELRGKKEDGSDNKKGEKKLKKKLAKIEKKKKEKEELKQKLMTVGRNAGGKGNLMKGVEAMGATVKKPGVKTEKGVVFSKFDFKDDMNPESKEKKKNLDPQAALNKLKKSKEKIKMWEDKGRTEKASKIENNIAWENAINKAQGEKVKDDVTLLKKSIKKQKQIKTSSKKKWDKRAEEVKSKESAFVEKREGNLNKRIKEKKEKKMKKLVAKGRHVPGFGS